MVLPSVFAHCNLTANIMRRKLWSAALEKKATDSSRKQQSTQGIPAIERDVSDLTLLVEYVFAQIASGMAISGA